MVGCGVGREREAEWFVPCGERQIWGGEGGEECADVDSPLGTQGNGDVQVLADAQHHVWVCGQHSWNLC